MDIFRDKNGFCIKDIKDFDIGQTLECGQCFHFEKVDDNEYGVVAFDKLLHVKQEGGMLYFLSVQSKKECDFWVKYFDLKRDYGKIKRALLKKDNKLKEAINDKWGVRIINQEFTETLMSFIISQNKQIPHIKKIVADISKEYGKYLGSIKGKDFYSFPDLNELDCIKVEEYRKLKTGFRAPYLYDAFLKMKYLLEKLSDNDKNAPENKTDDSDICDRYFVDDLFKSYFNNMSEEECRESLKQIKGVGDKVANCVLLFSLGFRASFPIDVWIKRIMEKIYFKREASKEEIAILANELFAEYAGYAQQYIFYYGKEKGNKQK